MFELFLLIAGFAGGYIASIYSWPWIRLQANGLSAEAVKLRVRAQQLENKIRGAVMFAKFREKLKGWKTVIWNGFLGLAPVLLVAVDKLQAMDLTPYMTWYTAIAAGVVVSGVGIWLRYVTTGPVGAKGDEEPAPQVKAGD